MTWPPWLVIPCVLAVVAVGISAYGKRQWAGAMRALLGRLEAGRIDTGQDERSPPTRYDARELEGLPAPVQLYFRAVLQDGQPIIAAVTIAVSGTFNMSATGQAWKPFTSRQRVITRRPGFLWDARISMLPGATVHVVDSCIAGRGLLHAAIQGLCTMADVRGDGEIARGELMRWFAEAGCTRLRCCPARAFDGRQSTTIRRWPRWWMGRSA
jgi:hypothetical protein